MISNLIFHAVSKRKWQMFNKGGYFNPDDTDLEKGIVCVAADQLNSYLNKNFSDRRQVFLLVIEKGRLISRIDFDENEQCFYVEERINLDAILDKIRISPNKEGKFDIEVNEEG